MLKRFFEKYFSSLKNYDLPEAISVYVFSWKLLLTGLFIASISVLIPYPFLSDGARHTILGLSFGFAILFIGFLYSYCLLHHKLVSHEYYFINGTVKQFHRKNPIIAWDNDWILIENNEGIFYKLMNRKSGSLGNENITEEGMKIEFYTFSMYEDQGMYIVNNFVGLRLSTDS